MTMLQTKEQRQPQSMILQAFIVLNVATMSNLLWIQ